MATEGELLRGGLLRLPKFLKLVIQAIKEQQAFRDVHNEPSLISKDARYDDVVYSVVIAVSLVLCRILANNFVMPRLFPRQPRKMINKLTEDLYYTLYYLTIFAYFVFGVMPNVTWSCSLLSNTSSVVRDLLYPMPPPVNAWERWYYIQAFGFYLSGSFFLLIFDVKRSDFMQYLIHHIVTITMIVLSYLYGFGRAGIIVLGLHDVGDIFLYSSKFFHHLKVEGVDIALFFMFVVTFYVGRLVMFSRIVHAIIVETLQIMVSEPSFNSWAMFYDTYLPHYAVFTVTLSVLTLLHCFWYTLVLKIIGNELFYGKKIADEGDPRSDNEGDDEELEEFEEQDDGRAAVTKKDQ